MNLEFKAGFCKEQNRVVELWQHTCFPSMDVGYVCKETLTCPNPLHCQIQVYDVEIKTDDEPK